MPHSPRRVQRRPVIIQNPVPYQSPIRKKIDTTQNRSHSKHGDQKKLQRSSSQKSQTAKESPNSGSISNRRSYRYQRISSASPRGRSRSIDRSRKLAFCLAASILITLILIASGLYVYYFVDGENAKKRENTIIFSPTLLPTKAPTTTWIDYQNTSVPEAIGEKIEDSATWKNESFENTTNNGTSQETAILGLEEETVQDALYYSETVCIDDERNRECVAGSSAEYDTCDKGGSCTRVQYHANVEPDKEIFDPEAESRLLDLTSWPSPSGILCKRPDQRLGVCRGNQCLRVYNGTRRFHQIKSEWRDNCDRVNPCWTTSETIFLENRNRCANAPKDCNKDEQCASGATIAVVWMEHRYCYMNPARAGSYCQGLPLRLWLCRFCPGRNMPASDGLQLAKAHATDACLQKYNALPKSFNGDCIIFCHDHFTNETIGTIAMPNGSICSITDKDTSRENRNTGYCYKGKCFSVGASLYDQKLKTVEECEKDKHSDSQKWNLN